ncbi:MAG TPA: efflux RND transporter periplasmic adaptor subunit [Pirellulales bacterium]|nr:efflux RND transporter periplasmic adaptor subunit [Pirellulales bacterium]
MTGFWRTLSVALVVCIAATGCEKMKGLMEPPAAASAPPAPKPPEVLFTLPTTAEITDYEDFTGRTVARRTIDIRARVTGYLDRIQFKDGGEVKQNDLLFEIDQRQYKTELARTEAALAQAKAHLKRLELDVERANKLIESKQISRAEFDLVNGDRAEAEAAVKVAKANLHTAELNVGFTQVRAPLAGQISRTQLDPGNLVKADDTILTTLVTLDPIFAYFEVDERTLLMMRRYVEQGQIKADDERQVPVLMGLADEEGFPHKGTINFVDNRLDVATGTLQVRGIFENPTHILSPGLFVRVRLPIGEAYSAILIDERALGTDQGQKFVFVIDEKGNAQYRRVEVGKLQNGQRVVRKGIAEGDRVVVSGLQRVRPGAPVTAKPENPVAEMPGGGSTGVAQAESSPQK